MVEVAERNGNAAAHQVMNDLDPPLGRDSALVPFEAGLATNPKFGGGIIDHLPRQAVSHHGCIIGHIVQAVNPIVSKESGTARGYGRCMAGMSDEAAFNEALCARVHQLRTDRGWTAEQMATALGVPPDRYRKYEYRSPLPHYLVERFALIVGRDVEYILTGKAAPRRAMPLESKRKRA